MTDKELRDFLVVVSVAVKLFIRTDGINYL